MSRGYGGKLAIHRNQLEIIDRCFSPSQDEIDWALNVLQQLKSSRGRAVGVAGLMVDEAVKKRAQRIIQVARLAGLNES